MAGYSFGGNKDDFERFRNAGGGPRGSVAGGRSARRPGIAASRAPASTGNPSLDLALAGQREKRGFEAGQNALDRRQELTKTQLAGDLAGRNQMGVQGLSNRGAYDRASLQSKTQLEERGMQEAGADRRSAAGIAGATQQNRDRIAGQAYLRTGSGDIAEKVAGGSFAAAGGFNVNAGKDNWVGDEILGPDGESIAVQRNQQTGEVRRVGDELAAGDAIRKYSEAPVNENITDDVRRRLEAEEEEERRRARIAGTNRLVRSSTGAYSNVPTGPRPFGGLRGTRTY